MRLLRLLRKETQDSQLISKALKLDPTLGEKISWDEATSRWGEWGLTSWIHELLTELVPKARQNKQQELFGDLEVTTTRETPLSASNGSRRVRERVWKLSGTRFALIPLQILGKWLT